MNDSIYTKEKKYDIKTKWPGSPSKKKKEKAWHDTVSLCSQSMKQIETYHTLLVCTKRVCCIKEVTATFAYTLNDLILLSESKDRVSLYTFIRVMFVLVARAISKSYSIGSINLENRQTVYIYIYIIVTSFFVVLIIIITFLKDCQSLTKYSYILIHTFYLKIKVIFLSFLYDQTE